MSAATRPVGRGRLAERLATPAVGGLIVLLAALLRSDRLSTPRLHLDDFAFLAESRSAPRLLANLATPHNAHVVPLFRLLAFLVARLAGSLADAPVAFTWSAFAALVGAMLAVGAFVRRESRSRAVGLAAMAGVGLTSVSTPSATWFSASQPLWAGLAIVLMLIALQGWRGSGGRWRLALAATAAIASPALWSGGYAAGPVGLAYLVSDRRAGRWRAALIPIAASACYAAGALAWSGSRLLAAANFHDRPLTEAAHPLLGLLHTAQAIPEVLVLANLGLDAETTTLQAILFCAGLAGLWLWSRREKARPSPMEAAGASLVLLGFLLVYTFRGYLPWSSLRPLGWYHALPQIGAVLFATGWWAATRNREAGRAGWLGPTGAAALSLAFFTIQRPREARHFAEEAPPLTPSERLRFPVADLRHVRAAYFAAEGSDRQRRALARLDQAERLARRLGLGRDEFRRAFGRAEPPGWPPTIKGLDAFDLLDLDESTGRPVPAGGMSSLGELLRPEPGGRPPWIAPEERWPAEPTPP